MRFIALFEILKGTGVLLVSLLLTFNIGNVHELVAEVCRHLRMNFIEDTRIIVLFAVVYAGLRSIEGYGLWNGKRWGATIGIISVAMYLPFEFYEIFKHPSIMKAGVTVLNIGLLVYLILWKRKKATVRSA